MTGTKGYSTVLNSRGGKGGIIWAGRTFFSKFLKQRRVHNKITLWNFGNLAFHWEGESLIKWEVGNNFALSVIIGLFDIIFL